MYFLRFIDGDRSTHERRLTGGRVRIGRQSDNDIVLIDGMVSGWHAQFVKASDGWHIEDLNSTNHTYVNDKQITRALLKPDDRIQVGNTKIIFIDSGVASDYLDRSRFLASESLQDALPSISINDADLLFQEIDSKRGLDLEADRKGLPTLPDFSVQLQEKGELFETRADASLQPFEGESLAETKVRLIQRVSEKLMHIFDLKQLMNEIMTIVMDQTGADSAISCRVDEAGQPVPIASRGMIETGEIRIAQTVLDRVVRDQRGVVVNAPANSECPASSEQGSHSTMCVPLCVGPDVIGLLALNKTTGEHFNPRDLELLLAIAHQAAVGIERARFSRLIEKERRRRDYLSKYLDERVVEQISELGSVQSGSSDAQSVDPLAPAERKVTVLFSDIVSFTKACEKKEPADIADFLREYLTEMTRIIFKHGGTIDKYIGDAVMALFGVPVPSASSKIDTSAAIRAALEMKAFIKTFEPSIELEADLRIRVGIKTGTAIVGNLGSNQRREFTAVGDTVNVASRLETFARPGEICIDDDTYEVVADEFNVEALGNIDLRNRNRSVVVYKVLGITGT